jgi:PAS domain S-box-containing protein
MVNQTVADLFGTSKDEIISKGPEFLAVHPVNVVLDRESDRLVIEQKKTVETNEQMTLSNGEKRWVNTIKKPLTLSDGQVNVLGVSVDITPIKQHAEALEDAKKVKEQFLANISHEIRTPINGIVGMIKMLESSPTLPGQKKYLDAIKKSSETLQVLISDILDFSIIESGNIRFDNIGFKPKPLLNALIDSFRYAANEKGIQLTLNYDPYVDEVLIGDPVRLNQILLNLLGNAIKFTQKGYVRIYVLKKNDSEATARLQFIVEDSGIGIDEKNLQRIFESFEQADVKITRNYGGTGLGLSIVRQLVELQGGQINVESKTGTGTRFLIDLEYHIGSDKDLEVRAGIDNQDTSTENHENLKDKRFLIVEDNEVNLLYSKMLLERWNCSVDTASNGLEALDRLKENDYDMILMDVLMPVMNGYEATRFIRNQFKPPKSRTRIIAITANARKSDIEKHREAGVNDYLSKPYTPEELKAVILKHINSAQESPVEDDDTRGEPVINLSYLEKISGNDPVFIKEMIRSFISESPKDLKNMRNAYRMEDWRNVRELAHKIKPSLTFMGMKKTIELLNALRDAARTKDRDVAIRLIDRLDVTINRAINDLQSDHTQTE